MTGLFGSSPFYPNDLFICSHTNITVSHYVLYCDVLSCSVVSDSLRTHGL